MAIAKIIAVDLCRRKGHPKLEDGSLSLDEEGNCVRCGESLDVNKD